MGTYDAFFFDAYGFSDHCGAEVEGAHGGLLGGWFVGFVDGVPFGFGESPFCLLGRVYDFADSAWQVSVAVTEHSFYAFVELALSFFSGVFVLECCYRFFAVVSVPQECDCPSASCCDEDEKDECEDWEFGHWLSLVKCLSRPGCSVAAWGGVTGGGLLLMGLGRHSVGRVGACGAFWD